MEKQTSFQLTAPLIQQHELTSKCNNLCGFCYNPERCQAAFAPREEDRARNLAVAEKSAEKVMAVCLTGGEPLLMGGHFWEVYDIYAAAECYMSINSNGRLITDQAAEQFAKRRLNSALVSIHGLREMHNKMVGDVAFDETLAGILRLQARGISVTPNFVATAKNVFSLRAVGEMLAENGIQSMTATPFLPSWGAKNHNEFLLNQKHYQEYFEAIGYIRTLGVTIDATLPIPPCVLIKLFPETWRDYLDVHSPRVCMAGKSFGVVSPDGLFRACIQAPYLAEFGGSVENDYDAAWQRAGQWADMKLIPRECQDCAALNICGGGCRTGCMWDNAGSVSGSTMYMGEPLTSEETQVFVDRVTSPARYQKVGVAFDTWCKDYPTFVFRFRPFVKVRRENGRTVIFNTRNQSFTIVNGMFDPSAQFATNKVKTASVLAAMGAVERRYDDEWTLFEPSIVSANEFMPRLGQGLVSEDKVFSLRADTGERYFF